MITPLIYKAYFKKVSDTHKQILGFFRMNLAEIQGGFRSGIGFPALVLESYEGDLSGTKIASTINRGFAFSIYLSPKMHDYDDQDNALSSAEKIGIDIVSRMHKDSFNPDSVLYNNFDKNSVTWHKVGPVFVDNLYGYRFVGSLEGPQSLKVDNNVWSDLQGTPLANKLPKIL